MILFAPSSLLRRRALPGARPHAAGVRRGAALLAALLLPLGAIAGHLPLFVITDQARIASAVPCSLRVRLPGENNWPLLPDQATNWLHARAIRYSIFWPTNAPARCQTMLYLIDRDDRWYQAVQEQPLRPGATNCFEVPFGSGAPAWQAVGHAASWHHRVKIRPRRVALRIFGREGYTGDAVLVAAELVPEEPPRPPAIARVRPIAKTVACFQLFEVAFDLPDRYDDPFDPAQVDVSAVFTTPEGTNVAVNGFYYQAYFRTRDETQNPPQPQGHPEWRVRFCPRTPGDYRYALRVKDAAGTAAWNEGAFTATPTNGPRFVRVSPADRRYFELDDGTVFFPIGHNVRSPYDSRMEDKFPWKLRHPEGTLAYQRFLHDMAAAGENLVEIWSCAWSLGLEWSAVSPGYHGAGDYHLGNAWELDRVLELARQNRLRVNLVLNNHGRVSEWLDNEWNDNPYNAARGGWLKNSIDFFDDYGAAEMQRRLYRYYLARLGWDSTIFAWELFSEVNLTGNDHSQRTANDPRVVEWHRQFGAWFHAQDPNRHLVTTHISADYTFQNPALCQLPEIDACAVDAYHYAPHPGQIVQVLQGTARCNNAFDKPVLVTEFGGSPMAAGLEHLKRELHAAIWSATAIPISGTPLFWWWQVIEERQLYGEYAALARYLQGWDPRNPALVPATPLLRDAPSASGALAAQLQVVAMSSGTNAVGWIYYPPAFGQRVATDTESDPSRRSISQVQLVLTNFSAGIYRANFVDTSTGQSCKRADVRGDGSQLVLDIPVFTRDIAFRVMPVAR